MAEQDDSASTANSVENSAVDPRYAGLKPWQPGQSGNPSGRPKSKPITEMYEQFLSDPENRAKWLQGLAKAIERGDVQIFREIADRIEGKALQQISGPDGGPIPLEVLCDIDDGGDD